MDQSLQEFPEVPLLQLDQRPLLPLVLLDCLVHLKVLQVQQDLVFLVNHCYLANQEPLEVLKVLKDRQTLIVQRCLYFQQFPVSH